MAKQHHRSANPASAFAPFAVSPSIVEPTLEAITRSGEVYGRAVQALSEEAVRFTTARLERDGEFGRQLAACRSWTDAAALQRDWMATAAQDYAEEASRVIQLMTDFGDRALHTAETGVETAAQQAQKTRSPE